MNIFPSSPPPDKVFSSKQTKDRIVSKTEKGYSVKRHRSNIATRSFTFNYTNRTLAERNVLRDFLIQQDYGITGFLFKNPVEDLTKYISSNQDSLIELNNAATGNLAQGFQTSIQTAIHKVQLYLKKVGSPSGNVLLKLATDNSGKPSSSIMATSDNVAVSSITGSYTLVEFNFDSFVRVEPFVQYHIILEGDSTYDSSFATGVTAVQLGVDGSSPSYGYGNISTWAPSVWTADATKCAIFTIPDYTKVQTEQSLWSEERISAVEGGLFNFTLVLFEDF